MKVKEDLLRKYGEIGRFTHENVTYIIEMCKERNYFSFCDENFIPWIAFYRTQKSCKNSKCSKKDKEDKACSIENKTWNPVVINKAYAIIEDYCKNCDIKYISHAVYDGENMYLYDKRKDFYEKMLNRMGYEMVYTDNSQDYYYETTYYYRRKEGVE